MRKLIFAVISVSMALVITGCNMVGKKEEVKNNMDIVANVPDAKSAVQPANKYDHHVNIMFKTNADSPSAYVSVEGDFEDSTFVSYTFYVNKDDQPSWTALGESKGTRPGHYKVYFTDSNVVITEFDFDGTEDANVTVVF